MKKAIPKAEGVGLPVTVETKSVFTGRLLARCRGGSWTRSRYARSSRSRNCRPECLMAARSSTSRGSQKHALVTRPSAAPHTRDRVRDSRSLASAADGGSTAGKWAAAGQESGRQQLSPGSSELPACNKRGDSTHLSHAKRHFFVPTRTTDRPPSGSTPGSTLTSYATPTQPLPSQRNPPFATGLIPRFDLNHQDVTNRIRQTRPSYQPPDGY